MGARRWEWVESCDIFVANTASSWGMGAKAQGRRSRQEP